MNSNSLIVIVNPNCEFCHELLEEIQGDEYKEVEFIKYWAFQSRVGDRWEIRRDNHQEEIFPVLFSKIQIPEFPALYDPVTGEIIIGLDSIRQYFVDCGIIIDD